MLAPYLAVKGVYLQATQISKKGEKGGDVKFSRTRRDVVNFLKQRGDLVVSTFVDYYGVKEWPGLEAVRDLYEPTPDVIAKIMNDASVEDIRTELPNAQVDRRYIPFTAVHEFEALLFSDAEMLSRELGIDIALIRDALTECGSPERINNHLETSPSNRFLFQNLGERQTTTHSAERVVVLSFQDRSVVDLYSAVTSAARPALFIF